MRGISLAGKALMLVLVTAACNADRITPLETSPEPTNVGRLLLPSGKAFSQVDTWNTHACALRADDGFVECWGDNTAGHAPLAKAPSGGVLTQVAVGQAHSCALQSLGAIECWGYNGDGRAPPIRTAMNGVFDQVSAGDGHTCGRRTDGVIECWGVNDDGQAPAERAAQTGFFTHVSAGRIHTCATRNDGVAECWGMALATAAPAIKTPISGVFVRVATGQVHTCALRNDGVVQCWGDNNLGQGPAVKTAANGAFVQISTHYYHTCAVRSDGVVECWGLNSGGQAPATRTAATGVFINVSAGTEHTCAVRNDGVVECWGVNAWGQAPPTRAPVIRVFPIATFTAAPATVASGQSFSLTLTDARVPGYSGTVTFSYAFDCGDGAGYGPFDASNSASCATAAAGARTVKGIVRDHDGDETEYTGSVNVTFTYAFGSFVDSVYNPPVVNVTKAGSAVPLKFSLGGDQGLAILASGYPRSQPVQCDATLPGDPIEETVAAGASSLSYDAITDLYTYVWKTDRSWASTCRRLTLRLIDGTEHTAVFNFSR